MLISRMKTNHVVNPLGFSLGQPRLSWVVEDTAETPTKTVTPQRSYWER